MQGAYSYIANMYLMCILFRPADVPTQKKPKAEEKLSLAQAAIIAGVSDVGVLSIRHMGSLTSDLHNTLTP